MMILVIWLLAFVAIGFVAAVLDYWDFEDLVFVTDWNWRGELIRKQELSDHIKLH